MNRTMVGLMNILLWSLCIVLGGSVVYLNLTGVLKQDSQVEEAVEDVIEELVDVEIDLSPFSKESRRDR